MNWETDRDITAPPRYQPPVDPRLQQEEEVPGRHFSEKVEAVQYEQDREEAEERYAKRGNQESKEEQRNRQAGGALCLGAHFDIFHPLVEGETTDSLKYTLVEEAEQIAETLGRELTDSTVFYHETPTGSMLRIDGSLAADVRWDYEEEWRPIPPREHGDTNDDEGGEYSLEGSDEELDRCPRFQEQHWHRKLHRNIHVHSRIETAESQEAVNTFTTSVIAAYTRTALEFNPEEASDVLSRQPHATVIATFQYLDEEMEQFLEERFPDLYQKIRREKFTGDEEGTP